jgi:hypothetical protein
LANYSIKNLLSFILPSLKSCRSNSDGRTFIPSRTCWYYNRYSSFNFEIFKLPFSKKFRKTEDFFRWEDKYQKHSKELVDALKTWADSITFPYYEYTGGFLRKYPYSTTVNEIDIHLLKQAKDHLEKSYSHIFKMHDNIEIECKRLCEKIQEVIKAKYQLSFEHIITSEIYLACPKLKMTQNEDLKESNIYIGSYIFNIIFKNQPLDDVDDLFVNDTKLVYHRITTIAQGEESDMENLKQVILELISNNNIRNKIEKYHQLYNELRTKPETLKKEIRYLYAEVQGGKKLEKSKDCDICQTF